jgi:hypothetical protein
VSFALDLVGGGLHGNVGCSLELRRDGSELMTRLRSVGTIERSGGGWLCYDRGRPRDLTRVGHVGRELSYAVAICSGIKYRGGIVGGIFELFAVCISTLADSEGGLCKSAVLMFLMRLEFVFLSFRRRIGVEGYVGLEGRISKKKKKRKRRTRTRGATENNRLSRTQPSKKHERVHHQFVEM